MSTEAFYAFALIWLLSGLVVLLIGSRSARRKIKPTHHIFLADETAERRNLK